MNYQRWKNIMKAYPFEEKRLQKWSPPYIIQPKYDGIRCRAVRTKNGFLLLSSEENIVFSVPHINNALKIQVPQNIEESDGELYCHGMTFDEIISITSRTVNLHPDYKKMQYHIFDIVNEENQSKRLITLAKLDLKNPLIISPYWLANSLEEIMQIYNELISMGYEGIIVRHFLNIYERKRSTFMMKFKPKKSDTYKIVGFKEEYSISGEPKNSLGSLICLSGDGNIFHVGSGFTQEERKNLWKSRDKLIGKKCKVEYQHITSGKQVPRFPIFSKIVN